MEEYTLYIDPITKDFVIDEETGLMRTIEDNEAIAQGLRLTLEAIKGEFFSDENHGTRHREISSHKISSLSDDEIDEIIREALFQEPRVSQVTEITHQWTEKDRKLKIDFKAVLFDGKVIRMEDIYV